jgi:hypothetical protein
MTQMHLFLFFSENESPKVDKAAIESANKISVILLDQHDNTTDAIKEAGLIENPKCDFSVMQKKPTSLHFCKCLTTPGEDWQIVGMREEPVTVRYYERSIVYIFGLWNETWEMPQFMKDFMEVGKMKCPEFCQELLDAQSVASIIGTKAFDKIKTIVPSRRVCRADLCRYYVMMNRGGLYLDLDVRVKQDLGTLVDECIRDGVEVLLFTEHDDCDIRAMGEKENKQYTQRIYNCMFWSVPKHPIWKACIDLAEKRCKNMKKQEEWSDTDVIWSTGPDVITTVWTEKYKTDPKVRVLEMKDTFLYLHHMYKGTWRNKDDVVANS